MLRKLSLVATLAGALALPTAAAAWDCDNGWEHHGIWEHGDRGYYYPYYAPWSPHYASRHYYGWRRHYCWHYRSWDYDTGYYSRRRCWVWNGWQWEWICY